MAEVIVVATKQGRPVSGAELDINYTILSDRPSSAVAGVETARAIKAKVSDVELLMLGSDSAGISAISALGAEMRGQPVGVASLGVLIAAADLKAGRLTLPRHQVIELPITPLDGLGYRGPVHRDISGRNPDKTSRGPFDIIKLPNRATYLQASWPVLWSHDHKAETTMTVLPCSEGIERPGMREEALVVWEGRPDWAEHSIAGATRLHINNDFRVNSQPVAACLTPVPAIGGRAWPSFRPIPDSGGDAEIWEKVLCVWLNSTPGLLGRWWVSNRQQNGRANLTVTTMRSIPVLDLRTLTIEQRQALAEVFDEFASRPMLPANEAYRDEARQELDERVLCGVLGLPITILDPLTTLRLQWCAEPSVHGGKKTRP